VPFSLLDIQLRRWSISCPFMEQMSDPMAFAWRLSDSCAHRIGPKTLRHSLSHHQSAHRCLRRRYRYCYWPLHQCLSCHTKRLIRGQTSADVFLINIFNCFAE
jgi:hypothetical protein